MWVRRRAVRPTRTPECVRIAVNRVVSLIAVLFAVNLDRADFKALPCRGEQAADFVGSNGDFRIKLQLLVERTRMGGNIVEVPIEIPKVFQPRKFRVTIGKAQVNRARQVLPDIRVLWRAERATAAMSGDQAALDFRH